MEKEQSFEDYLINVLNELTKKERKQLTDNDYETIVSGYYLNTAPIKIASEISSLSILMLSYTQHLTGGITMTKKERTIKGIVELINRYEHPHGKTFFTEKSCPLCKIHKKQFTFLNGVPKMSICKGCPMASLSGGMGCINTASYTDANSWMINHREVTAINENWVYNKANGDAPIEFHVRALFHMKMLAIIRQLPSSRFTRNGWRYFQELLPIRSISIKTIYGGAK